MADHIAWLAPVTSHWSGDAKMMAVGSLFPCVDLYVIAFHFAPILKLVWGRRALGLALSARLWGLKKFTVLTQSPEF